MVRQLLTTNTTNTINTNTSQHHYQSILFGTGIESIRIGASLHLSDLLNEVDYRPTHLTVSGKLFTVPSHLPTYPRVDR